MEVDPPGNHPTAIGGTFVAMGIHTSPGPGTAPEHNLRRRRSTDAGEEEDREENGLRTAHADMLAEARRWT